MLDLLVQLAAAGAALAVMVTAWVASLALRDASLADVAWGLTFIAIAWASVIVGEGDPGRGMLVALLVTIWGTRLALHLGTRRDGGDRRYRALRERHGERFARRSLWSVFGAQAAVAWVVSLPVQVAATDPSPDLLGALAWAGTLVFALGLAWEAVADFQLERFRRNPLNRNAVLGSGAWRYSRHPNYFGDACVWWGIWIVALDCGSAWWTLIAPALMTYVLVRVSGVPIAERGIAERRPGYEDYARRTSSFVPLPPRS